MRQLTIVGVLLLAVATSTACNERPEMFYATADAARQDRAVERGWIPNWLPGSARDIHELHDIDTNQGIVAFLFDPADSLVLAVSCEQIQPNELKPVPFTTRWWPNDVPPSSVVTPRHGYYRCRDGSYVAVSHQEGQLYYWRP